MHKFLSLLACAICFLPSLLHAGQGPQNVVVVINARSPFSMEVGHRYAKLRNIPRQNLIYLDWDGPPIGTDVETFRQRILTPLYRNCVERKLMPHLTTIAYSSDFPYVVDFKADLETADPRVNAVVDPTARQFPQGSLTALTYFSQSVMAKAPVYATQSSNSYYRPSLDDKLLLPTRSFLPGAVWNREGDTTDSKGMAYMMSMMLAHTSGRGNSLAEVDDYLHNSVIADGTYPAGTIYFLTNGDVRARTRAPAFKATASRLESLGVDAEVIEGVLPPDRGDAMGAMIGAVDYRFNRPNLRPGAICENLTSFGGILRENGGQTALTECLRAGAAGSSGTITEPFAIQAKFPHPMIHVHYAQGCSLAESFYQSVQGPYQLLIVGDPLCRPWATIPTVRVAGLPTGDEPVKGQLVLTPSASTVSGKRVGRYEVYHNGQLTKQIQSGDKFSLDTTTWNDGSHELRFVGYEDSPIGTQGQLFARVTTNNHGWKPIELRTEPAGQVAWDQPITIHALSPGAGAMMLVHQQRTVGILYADRGSWTLPAGRLGLGPGELQVVATRGAGPENGAVGAPVPIEVVPSPALPARQLAEYDSLKIGLRLHRAGKDPIAIQSLVEGWPAKAELKAGEEFRLESIFQTNSNELHQFQFQYAGELEILVDGHSLDKLQSAKPTMVYLPVALQRGQHTLEIRGKLSDARLLNGWFGFRGTSAITSGLFRHVE